MFVESVNLLRKEALLSTNLVLTTSKVTHQVDDGVMLVCGAKHVCLVYNLLGKERFLLTNLV